MKKLISLITLLFTLKLSFAVITVLPANLNGVNDTARCQHSYSKKFSATPSNDTYHFTIVSGTVPQGLQLDSIRGILGGMVGYTDNTSISFTIRARKIVVGSSSYGSYTDKAYTLYIRNTILTTAQLTTVWSQSVMPSRANVYDTWYNAVTIAQNNTIEKWSKNGDALTDWGNAYLGSTDSMPFSIISKNVALMTFKPTGNIGIGTTSPTTKLHLSGANGFRYTDGLQGSGKVLISDGNGVASWGDIGTPWKLNGNTLGAKTFIGSLDSETVAIRVNDVERWTFLPNGKTGVNKTVPTAMLDIRGSGASSATTGLRVASGGGIIGLAVLDDAKMYSDDVVIGSIGTGAGKLEVHGNQGASSELVRLYSGGSDALNFEFRSDSNAGLLYINNSSAQNTISIYGQQGYIGSNVSTGGFVKRDNAFIAHNWLINVDSTGAITATDLGVAP